MAGRVWEDWGWGSAGVAGRGEAGVSVGVPRGVGESGGVRSCGLSGRGDGQVSLGVGGAGVQKRGGQGGGDGVGELPGPAVADVGRGDLQGPLGPPDCLPRQAGLPVSWPEAAGRWVFFVAHRQGTGAQVVDQHLAGVVVLVGLGAAGPGVLELGQVLWVAQGGELAADGREKGVAGEHRAEIEGGRLPGQEWRVGASGLRVFLRQNSRRDWGSCRSGAKRWTLRQVSRIAESTVVLKGWAERAGNGGQQDDGHLALLGDGLQAGQPALDELAGGVIGGAKEQLGVVDEHQADALVLAQQVGEDAMVQGRERAGRQI